MPNSLEGKSHDRNKSFLAIKWLITHTFKHQQRVNLHPQLGTEGLATRQSSRKRQRYHKSTTVGGMEGPRLAMPRQPLSRHADTPGNAFEHLNAPIL